MMVEENLRKHSSQRGSCHEHDSIEEPESIQKQQLVTLESVSSDHKVTLVVLIVLPL